MRPLDAADPVAAFLDAHEAGIEVALPTSGTSGPSRWVLRSTTSWVASHGPVADLTGLTAGSRVWVPGPLSATMNLFAAVHARRAGATRVDGPARATHAQLTPSGLARCLDTRQPLHGVCVVVAGDRLTRSLHDRACEAGAVVHHYYGAAELSFVAWGAHADDLRSFPGVEVEVRDSQVWVRTPYLCSGYDGPPGPLRVGADGWATVGDRGTLDTRRLSVFGRPDAVTVGGTTVETADVEGVLRTAARGQVVVVGLAHPDLGHVLAAVLSERGDHVRLRRLARTRLAGPARPRLWFHLAEVPLTGAGKVDREALVSVVSSEEGAAQRMA